LKSASSWAGFAGIRNDSGCSGKTDTFVGAFADKSVIVTGGSAGLGLIIARKFLADGARVAIVGRDLERLSHAAEALRPSGGKPVLSLQADITQPPDVERLVGKVVSEFGGVEALIHCAGRSTRGAIGETTVEQFQELLDINFLAVVRCTRVALPHLLASRGHVVFIGSLASKIASRYLGAYPASKYPLAAYAQQLRLELGPQGLHSLLVCPGPLKRNDSGRRYDEQSAGLPEAARKPGGGAKVKGIDPETLATAILRACELRKPELVMPSKARLLFAISQIWPALGDRLLLKFTGG
jgi:uncharacterized protein